MYASRPGGGSSPVAARVGMATLPQGRAPPSVAAVAHASSSGLNIVRSGAPLGSGLGGPGVRGSFLGGASASMAPPRYNDGGRFIVTGADGRGGQHKVLVPLAVNAPDDEDNAAPPPPAKRKKTHTHGGAAAPGAGGIERWVAAASHRVLGSGHGVSPPEPR
jgi:hypothetical protein